MVVVEGSKGGNIFSLAMAISFLNIGAATGGTLGTSTAETYSCLFSLFLGLSSSFTNSRIALAAI